MGSKWTELRRGINDGDGAGSRRASPSYPEQLGVSRPPVRTALANLETVGLIRRAHGGGTLVSKRPVVIENPLDSIEGLYPRMTRRIGFASLITEPLPGSRRDPW